MTSSAQLEREAEQTRAQLAQTLDELRERITPGQLVDQAVDYAKDSGGGVFVRNLGGQVTANPLPVALIGAGVAWLMLSNGARSATNGSAGESAIERARQAAVDTAAQMSGAARSAANESAQGASGQAGRTARSAAESVASLYKSARSGGSDAYGHMSDKASRATSTMTDSAHGLGQTTANAGRDFLQFCKSQPLFLGGLGLAMGAIIGVLIPPSDTEDRLMGETRDQMKDQVRDFAEEQSARAKSAASFAAATQGGIDEGEAEFQFQNPDAPTSVQAETSLVPDAEQGSEHETSDAPADPRR